MTYPETIEFLYRIRLFGQKLGLETMRQLLRQMGDPQDGLRFIHIAGTNGKGSVAAMLHSVLASAGYRTGLYTSPHLVSFCERFQINGQPIAESDVVRLVEDIRPLLDKAGAHPEFRAPTFFEVVTALALQYFREQEVDVVVWETGMGGRLDATNVVSPLVSVITNIGFDHMQHLGNTLAKIAYEKAGIIKPGLPTVTAASAEEALRVIEQTCIERASPLTVVGRQVHAIRLAESLHCQRLKLSGTQRDYGVLELPLLGAHQTINCATAIATLESSGLEFNADDVRAGLAHASWPARFQVVGTEPPVILDGAHNAAAAAVLATSLREHFAGKRLALILGVLRDKNFDQICALLAPLAETVICVPVNSERTSDPAQLAPLCRRANPRAQVHTANDLKEAYANALASRPDAILITGSLFLTGEALNRLDLPVSRAAACKRELVLQ